MLISNPSVNLLLILAIRAHGGAIVRKSRQTFRKPTHERVHHPPR